MAKVLVTGSTGFVGSHLVEALVERGDKIRALARASSNLSLLNSLDVEIRFGKLQDPASLDQALKDIDVVYHCAARPPLQGTRKQYHTDNAIGTQNLISAVLESNIKRFLHVSTVDVYGYVPHNGTGENAPCIESKEYYQMSKIHSEQTVMRAYERHGLPITIVRPCAIYGPYDSNSFPGIIKYLSKPIAPLIDGGGNLMDLVYVKDVADAIILAANSPMAVGQAYNITDGAKRTFKEIIYKVSDIVARKPKFVNTPSRTSYPITAFVHSVLMFFGSGLPKHYQPEVIKVMSMDRHFSIEKAQNELGYAPKMPLEQGIGLTADWYDIYRQTSMANRFNKRTEKPA